MRKKVLNIGIIVGLVLATSYNVYSSQQPTEMSDIALANVEALASNSESGGLPWKGYYSDWDKGCCRSGRWNDECSGSFSPCK